MVTKEEILSDDRFTVNTQVPDRLFKENIKKIEVVEVPLDKLLCYYGEGILFLKETDIFHYLDDGEDGKKMYEHYCEKYRSSFRTIANYKALIDEMNTFEYDIKKGAIVINQLGIILDGQHRCSILLKKYGAQHRISVVKFHYNNHLLGLRWLIIKKKLFEVCWKKLGRSISKKAFLEKIFISYCAHFQKGECYSSLLRRYYKDYYHINVGMYSYGCFNPSFNFGGKSVHVGRYCSIGPGVRYLGANHPIQLFSTSAIFYNKSLGFNVPDIIRHKLVIEDDVWIGINVIITSSCSRIGRGSILGAGCVVTKDVEPYSIMGGIPARLIKKRFDDKTIDELENSFWWVKEPTELIEEHKNEIYG